MDEVDPGSLAGFTKVFGGEGWYSSYCSTLDTQVQVTMNKNRQNNGLNMKM